MRITFQIAYRTCWGEQLCVLLEDNEQQPLLLSTTDGEYWRGTYDCVRPVDGMLRYAYAVYTNGVCTRRELAVRPHCFPVGTDTALHYRVADYWRDVEQHAYFYTTAFEPSGQSSRISLYPVSGQLVFRVLAPLLSRHNLMLALTGNCEGLGDWHPEQAVRLQKVAPGTWQGMIPADQLPSVFEYKWIAVDACGQVVHWEEGANRLFEKPIIGRLEVDIQPEIELFFPDISFPRLAGSAIPVFSLRSEGSAGIGDFGDLFTYVQWAHQTQQQVVQILPINDTTSTGTWQDSYPYNAISIYALHPLYIDLRQLPVPSDWKQNKHSEQWRKRLNALSQVDYEEVWQYKTSCLKAIYRDCGKETFATADFRNYFEENQDWLVPYAAFCYFREQTGTADYTAWGTYAHYRAEEIADLLTHPDVAEAAGYSYFIQYHLHVQLLRVSTCARRLGVVLKGDIPIGISRTSVEAWTEPHYFHLDSQAGAPPDAFSVEGQNWGFPTYNWKRMSHDGYRWWQQRFTRMATYFTAYRIDHILGFFRIWTIPDTCVRGILGHFAPSLPLSLDEIASFGLEGNMESFTRPQITDELLARLFGADTAAICQRFLQPSGEGKWLFKPEFATERAVCTAMKEMEETKASQWLQGLYTLLANVLFVPDPICPERLHPRIGVHQTPVFACLSQLQQERMAHLYEVYYYRRHNEFWYRSAMQKLPNLLHATSMLACGEDLGMVPDCVPWVMQELKILSLEIQRMPKQLGETFGRVSAYPYDSVSTIGTHDMSTLRGWWTEDEALTTRFYHTQLQGEGEMPCEATPQIAETLIRQHLEGPSMLCVLTWQDWTAIDARIRYADVDAERINVPANPRHYWRWRMHLSLEALQKDEDFNGRIRTLISKSGR